MAALPADCPQRVIPAFTMKHPTSRIRHTLAAGFAALAGAMAALAADVPWQFTGDDIRPAASVASAATPVATFVSWTMEADVGESDDIAFSSAPPAFVLVIR